MSGEIHLNPMLDVESKMNDVTILHDVLLPFKPPLTRIFCALLSLVLDKVAKRNDFRPNETPLEIGMNNPR